MQADGLPQSELQAPLHDLSLSELERLQSELQQRERESLELAYLRRTNGLEAIRDATRRLGELGSPQGVLKRAAAELGVDSQFDRIMISEITAGRMTPLTLWERELERVDPPALTLALDYPLVEHAVARDRGAELVLVAAADSRTPPALAKAFAWDSYVVAAIVVEGDAIGLLHADATDSARALDEVDREMASLACAGLGEVFGRAVMRDALQRHRAALQSAVGWLSGQLRATAGDVGEAAGASGGVDSDTIDTLTPREREILTLMARGQTNARIAALLGVREGTVKYHVKNVLRKLGARSRADAVARYARATGSTT